MGATILRHNLITIVTVLEHSLPIAKVLHIKSLRIFLLTISQLRIYQVVFLFFARTQNGAEKRKNNGRTGSNLYYVGIIQTSITKHSPKMYCYTFGETYYRLLAIAGIA